MSAVIEIEMEVDHGGLYIIMSKAVFDLGYVFSSVKEIHSPGVSKGVNRVDVFEAFMGQYPGEVFFTDSIDSMAGEFLTALIDKDALFIERLWSGAVFLDIKLEELRGFFLKLYEPVLISLAQDGEGFLLWIEVVEIQGCDLGGPGAGVKKEVKECVIPEPLLCPEIDGFEDPKDLIMIEEADEGLLVALLRNVEDCVRQFAMIRIHKADHFGKGFEDSEAVIPCSGQVFALLLEIIEEREDELRG